MPTSSSSTPKSWLLLQGSLPAEEGKVLLGTVVTDVQHPTDEYEPKRSDAVREHPFVVEADLLTPWTENKTIESSSTTGNDWNAHLYSLISSGYSKSVSDRATVASAQITTYSLRSPSSIFRRIRDSPKYWDSVEELVDGRRSKKLYFVRGYMVATNPTITIATSNERGSRAEITIPLVEAVTGVMSFTVDAMVGDPGVGVGSMRAQNASQTGTIQGDRLFAIQYWTVVKKGPRLPIFRAPKTMRSHHVEARPISGIMFGDKGSAPARQSGPETRVEGNGSNGNEDGDDDEWSVLDENGNKVRL